MPKVSVVMPVYNGAKHIREAIDSVLAQTFTDWDFWVINEYGSNDGSAEIIAEYARQDDRFHLIQNTERLGLAESLNLGFRQSSGEYIARLDADDLAHPERFAKQAALMDSRPEVGICGTWQHHFGKNVDWVHCPPASAGKCRAKLLFNCDLCHSTLMLRRKTVLEHNLFYDNSFGAEDYELWCRAMLVTDIVNIPEVLGEYREGEDNITTGKKKMLDVESGRLVARNLQMALGMTIDAADCELFQGWSNPFDEFPHEVRQTRLDDFERILRRIYAVNQRKRFCAESDLLSVLAAKWRWAKYHEPWNAERKIAELSQVFDENYKPSIRVRYRNFCAHNKTFRAKVKKICMVMLRPLARPIRRRIEGLLNNLEKNICDFVEAKTWDRYLRLSAELKKECVICAKNQADINRLHEQLRAITLAADARICQAEQNMTQTMDERIWKAEQGIAQTIYERIWKAEQGITQTMDGRIWKAEQGITQAIDGRIWKAEQSLTQSTDSRIWQAEQNINQTTDGRIWQTEKTVKHMERRLVSKLDDLSDIEEQGKIFLVGTPEHSNIGDAAIVLGEQMFIRKYFPKYRLIELSADDYSDWYEPVAAKIGDGDIIFLQGGGNLGDKYLTEENIRRQVVQDFPNNQIIILPQTVFFADNESGRRELNISAGIYNRHKRLLIMARGKQSLDFIKAEFPQIGGICVPDMALMLNEKVDSERKGILLCVRDLDDESGLTQKEYEQVIAIVKSLDADMDMTKNIYLDDYDSKIYKDMRQLVVKRELQRFAAHKVVVTDRLHGLIFAILTHTPCVVLSAYNYKIAEFCRTFIKSKAVFFLDRNLADLESKVIQALDTEFDSQPVIDENLFAMAYQMIAEGMK